MNNNEEVIRHYDFLIDEGNDPFHDPEPLKKYMDKWDGDLFFDRLCLSPDKTVLEIGVGTGRLAVRAAPLCKDFYGIDISPKTIFRAKQNLSLYSNINLICDDILLFVFDKTFDIIYSSLTFMHIKEKQRAFEKIASILNSNGRFILSIDKNQCDEIDIGDRKIKIYPDTPTSVEKYAEQAGLSVICQDETEFAYVISMVGK